MQHVLRTALALGLVLGVLPAGCGESCEASCGGGGAYVEWEETQLPEGAVRVCVNGTCATRQPDQLSNGRLLVTFNPEGDGIDLGERVKVRLEVIADGRVLTGEGERSGDCCPAYYLHVSDDGRTLIPRD